MKLKFLKYFIVPCLLIGCAQLQITSRPKTIRGESCIESPRLKVFQVFKDGILAHLCPTEYSSYYENAFEACIIKGDLVFMEVDPKSNDYVDNQKITLEQHQCFVSAGTFSYTRKDGVEATLRKIKILEEEARPNTSTSQSFQ